MSGRKKTITSGVREAGSIYDNVARDDASVGIVRTLAEPMSLRWNRSHDNETAQIRLILEMFVALGGTEGCVAGTEGLP